MSAPGYSGKPVSQKLGITDEAELWVLDGPIGYKALVGPLPTDFTVHEGLECEDLKPIGQKHVIVHLFVSEKIRLEEWMPTIADTLPKGAMLWISWPKKASRMKTDITEQTLRDVILPMGLVDVKVCAISEVWSGLKFLWRKESK